MKRISIFLSILMGMVLLFSACDTEQEGALYDMPSEFTNGVTFMTKTGKIAIDPGGSGKIAIPVFRVNPSGSHTVNATVNFGTAANVFSAPATSVTFNEGQTESEFVINYNYQTMQFNTNYSITVTLDSEEYVYIPKYVFTDTLGVEKTLATDQKLINATTLAVTKNLTWTYLGKVRWESEFWEETHDRDIWLADQLEQYRVLDIWNLGNGKYFEFVVGANGAITGPARQEVWLYSANNWTGAENISGQKVGNKFNILVGRFWVMPLNGGWNGPWKETGTLLQ